MRSIKEIDEILSNNESLSKYINLIENNNLQTEKNMPKSIKQYVKAKIQKEQKLKDLKIRKIFDYAKVAGFAVLVFVMSEAYIDLSNNIDDERVLGFSINIEEKIEKAGKNVSSFLLRPIEINKEDK